MTQHQEECPSRDRTRRKAASETELVTPGRVEKERHKKTSSRLYRLSPS